MPTKLILYFMFQEKDFKVITWVSIKYCEFLPFYKIKLSIFTLYGNQMNRISLKMLGLLRSYSGPSAIIKRGITSLTRLRFTTSAKFLENLLTKHRVLLWVVTCALNFQLALLNIILCLSISQNICQVVECALCKKFTVVSAWLSLFYIF